jgi:hypothetical protein
MGVAFNSPPRESTWAPLSSNTLQTINRPFMAAQCNGYATKPEAGSESCASGLAPCAKRYSTTSRAPCIAAQCMEWFNYNVNTHFYSKHRLIGHCSRGDTQRSPSPGLMFFSPSHSSNSVGNVSILVIGPGRDIMKYSIFNDQNKEIQNCAQSTGSECRTLLSTYFEFGLKYLRLSLNTRSLKGGLGVSLRARRSDSLC